MLGFPHPRPSGARTNGHRTRSAAEDSLDRAREAGGLPTSLLIFFFCGLALHFHATSAPCSLRFRLNIGVLLSNCVFATFSSFNDPQTKKSRTSAQSAFNTNFNEGHGVTDIRDLYKRLSHSARARDTARSRIILCVQCTISYTCAM